MPVVAGSVKYIIIDETVVFASKLIMLPNDDAAGFIQKPLTVSLNFDGSLKSELKIF